MSETTAVPGTGKLAAALSKAQGQMAGAKKDSKNPFFGSKYADLASVWDAIREVFSANGLAVIQKPSTRFIGEPEAYEWTAKSGEKRYGVRIATEVIVTTVLLHESGEREEAESSCMLSVADPQAVGSAITYLRRYSLQSMAGVAPEDDDAEAAHATGSAGAFKKAHQTRQEAPRTTQGDPGALSLEDEILFLAGEISKLRDGYPASAVIADASGFTGKDGRVMSFEDPRRQKSEKWKASTLTKLKDMLHKATMAAEPGAAEGAEGLSDGPVSGGAKDGFEEGR